MKEVGVLILVIAIAFMIIWLFGQFELIFGNFATQILIILCSLFSLGCIIEYCKRH